MQKKTQRKIKRIIDIFVSLIALIIITIPAIFICIIIKLTSRGPIFFVQKRVRQEGEIFGIIKFRSMVENAEELKKKLIHKNEISGPLFKISYDPRVTPFGNFMRKYSLDEIPQFFNVIKGDMSLVGPRPPTLNEYNLYTEYQKMRLSVPVGITGLWQISGRSQIKSFEEVVKLDLEYIENFSIWLDIKILFLTIPSVLTSRGAC